MPEKLKSFLQSLGTKDKNDVFEYLDGQDATTTVLHMQEIVWDGESHKKTNHGFMY